jgi:hypothetical protein
MTVCRNLAAIAAVFLAFGPARAQGLADFARGERMRRAAVPETEPITNATLADMCLLTKGAAPSSIPPTPAPEPSPKTPEEKPAKPEERGEQWWRAQFAAARENLSRAEAEAKAADSALKKAGTEFLIRSDIYNKEGQMGPQLQNLGAELEAAKRREDEARRKIAELEEDLRRSGGLPGWAR